MGQRTHSPPQRSGDKMLPTTLRCRWGTLELWVQQSPRRLYGVGDNDVPATNSKINSKMFTVTAYKKVGDTQDGPNDTNCVSTYTRE